ncbi:MAG: O-antigen ligase family protein [Pseudomonadota bacterium]
MKQTTGLVFVLMAAALGCMISLYGGELVLLALLALLPLPIIFRDYRAGVILLTFLLPVSSMLPPIRGLNILNFVIIATLGAFAIRTAFLHVKVVWLPGVLIGCFLLPATVGIVMAWPHIHEGLRNYPLLEKGRELYDPPSYVLTHYVKPFFYYFTYAFLLANAVRASKRPERFLAALAASAILPSLAVFYTVATYPGSLIDVSRDREFMAPRGLHANEFGMLLALASGPLLFLAFGSSKRSWRLMALSAFSVVTLALLLTFSRGALMAYLIVVGGFLWHHKRVKTFVASLAVVGLVVLAAPDAMQERFSTGFRSGAFSDASNIERDDLTAGRLHGWTLLAPEVVDSPWLGRGVGSTQWSNAVATGRYKANHPHNIYLEILMDLGLIGFVGMAYLHYAYLKKFKQLSINPTVPEELRSFFLGSMYAMWGMLAMAVTTAYYLPNGAQTYLWFSLGVAFAYWRQASPVKMAVSPSMRDSTHTRPMTNRPFDKLGA